MLVKQGYNLYYYSSDRPSIEMDFFVRDADSLVPIEVKANDSATASLNKLLSEDKYPDIKYGIKLGYKNVGFNGKFYTFPYFLTFFEEIFGGEKTVIHLMRPLFLEKRQKHTQKPWKSGKIP